MVPASELDGERKNLRCAEVSYRPRDGDKLDCTVRRARAPQLRMLFPLIRLPFVQMCAFCYASSVMDETFKKYRILFVNGIVHPVTQNITKQNSLRVPREIVLKADDFHPLVLISVLTLFGLSYSFIQFSFMAEVEDSELNMGSSIIPLPPVIGLIHTRCSQKMSGGSASSPRVEV